MALTKRGKTWHTISLSMGSASASPLARMTGEKHSPAKNNSSLKPPKES